MPDAESMAAMMKEEAMIIQYQGYGIYHEMAADLSGIKFMQVNISQEWEIAQRCGVDAMPTLL